MTIILTAAIALAALQTDRPPPVISISPSAVPTAPRPGQICEIRADTDTPSPRCGAEREPSDLLEYAVCSGVSWLIC